MDIAENPHNYKFSEVDASLVPNSLPDVDLAFINSNYAINAELLPKRDALILEDPDSPYVNIIVVREADKDKDEVKNSLMPTTANRWKKPRKTSSKALRSKAGNPASWLFAKKRPSGRFFYV